MAFPSYAQLHLALTHVPVVTALLAAATLVIAAVGRGPSTRRFGLVLLLVAGLAAVPAFLTGEGAEQVVEDRAGVSESVIERHEEAAELALALLLGGAAVAAAALVAGRLRHDAAARALFAAALLLALADATVLGWVAHLGGEIRHDEIRLASQAGSPAVRGRPGGAEQASEDD
jgi:hypothetical protein